MRRFEFARLSASAAALTLALSGCVTAPPAGTPATGGEAQRPRPTNPPPMTVPTPAPSVRPGAFIPPRVMNMPGLEGVIGSNAAALAAAYAFGIARNHPFTDGNKRTAWVFARLFLMLNGQTLSFTPRMAIDVVLALAAGELGEDELADWFRQHLG